MEDGGPTWPFKEGGNGPSGCSSPLVGDVLGPHLHSWMLVGAHGWWAVMAICGGVVQLHGCS